MRISDTDTTPICIQESWHDICVSLIERLMQRVDTDLYGGAYFFNDRLA